MLRSEGLESSCGSLDSRVLCSTYVHDFVINICWDKIAGGEGRPCPVTGWLLVAKLLCIYSKTEQRMSSLWHTHIPRKLCVCNHTCDCMLYAYSECWNVFDTIHEYFPTQVFICVSRCVCVCLYSVCIRDTHEFFMLVYCALYT